MTTPGEMVKAVKENAARLGLTWQLTIGTCVDGTTPGATRVTFDADTTVVVPAVSLIGTVATNTRVAIVSIPGGGQYIIGFLS
mgnify:CR=1 FL=1